MTEREPPASGGQSEEAKAWVARRQAADRAIAASQARQEKEQAAEQRHAVRVQAGANPMVFILGFLVVFGVLALLLWFFIDSVQCDPMITNRGSSAACRRAPQ